MEKKEIRRCKASPNSTTMRKLYFMMLLTAQNARQLHSMNYGMLPIYRLISNKALLLSFTLHIQLSEQSSSSHPQGITMGHKCYRIILTLKALIYTSSPEHSYSLRWHDSQYQSNSFVPLCILVKYLTSCITRTDVRLAMCWDSLL